MNDSERGSTLPGTLGTVPVWQLSDGEVAALVSQAETAIRAMEGVQLAAIAEGVCRGLPGAAGAGTGSAAPGRWLRSLISISPGDAARRVVLAQALFTESRHDELAPTREAVLAGSISSSHAGNIVAAVDRLRPPAAPVGLIDDATAAQAQQLLVDAARGDRQHAALDPIQLARAALTLTATLDPSAGDRLAKDEDRQHELRSLAVTALSSGMFHVAGLLTNTAGHALTAVLQSLAAPRPAADGTPDPRTAGMRLHDALDHATGLLLTDDGGLIPGSHGSANRLVVSVTTETLAAHLTAHTPGRVVPVAELPGRWPLSPLSAQTMACDADLVPVLTGPDRTPLDVGHTIYQFPTKQRTAIIERDRHCTLGTCTAPPAWCHVHHLHPYSRGGPTSTTNGALLCGPHHRYVHANNLIGRLDTGDVTWQAPSGANPHLPAPAVERAIAALVHRWQANVHHDRPPDTGKGMSP